MSFFDNSHDSPTRKQVGKEIQVFVLVWCINLKISFGQYYSILS